MLLIALLFIGCALPLAMPSPRALALCVGAGASVFVLASLSQAGAPQGSVIGLAGVAGVGMLIGAVIRALGFRSALAEDRAIRRRLPRELPQRHR